MSDFLTTQGVAFQLETIVTGARKRLVLVSPYLQLSQTLYERLREADGRVVKITLIYGKGTTSGQGPPKLASAAGPSLRVFSGESPRQVLFQRGADGHYLDEPVRVL